MPEFKQFNMYSEKKARKEAEKMTEKIKSGKAANYSEAERLIEEEKIRPENIDWKKNKQKREERKKEGFYNPEDEYYCDFENRDIQKQIEKSHELYETFMDKWMEKLDLSDYASIEKAYDEAKEKGLFKKAEEKRKMLFGNDVKFYGVSYLKDSCVNNCAYCPGGRCNRQKALEAGTPYPQKELTIEDAIKDTLAVLEDGHDRVCYLEGSPINNVKYPERLSRYITAIIEATKGKNLREIIINVEPMSTEGFQYIQEAVNKSNKKNGTKVALQFRVFQETYNLEIYKKMHPGNEDARGRKSNYFSRLESQSRAAIAGIDNVGLGALFGLNPKGLEEIEGLKNHVEKLKKDLGISPARICLPSANELTNIGVKIPHFLERGEYTNKNIFDTKKEKREVMIEKNVYEKFNELIYALLRLAVEVSIVSSERDNPAMLNILRKYADCETLNVHPGVGDNAKIPIEKTAQNDPIGLKAYQEAKVGGEDTAEFEQTTTFPRNPKETVQELISSGYNPIINFNAKNLRQLKKEQWFEDYLKSKN